MTWSILVRDPATGALGAAVATRFFAVGALCLHVEGKVGALATQALINPMYGSHGMAQLRAGDPPDAVAAALEEFDAPPVEAPAPPESSLAPTVLLTLAEREDDASAAPPVQLPADMLAALAEAA